MFAKLLKHDLRAVFKYWWIGAVAALGVSVFGGFSIMLGNANTRYTSLTDLGVAGTFLSIIGILLIPLFTQIILIIRYYQHFFSDEGYLTFTLPVKKTSLLDSKLVTGFIYMLSSYLLMVVSFFIMCLIPEPEDIKYMFDLGLGDMSKYDVINLILVLVAGVVYIFLFNAFIYACMTFASSIAKKHKALAGVGIYIGVRVFVFLLVRVLLIFGVFYTFFFNTGDWPELDYSRMVMYVLIGFIGIFLLLFGALYYFITALLHKKLNLV